MKNAHLRMGSLRFTKVLRDTTIDITVRMDRMIAEHAADNRSAQCHVLSVIGNDRKSLPSRRRSQMKHGSMPPGRRSTDS